TAGRWDSSLPDARIVLSYRGPAGRYPSLPPAPARQGRFVQWTAPARSCRISPRTVPTPDDPKPPKPRSVRPAGRGAPGARLIGTIGHSTRALEELIAILGAFGATVLVDVRTVPRSRH